MSKHWLVIATTFVTVLSCAAQPFTVIRSTVSSGIAATTPTLLVAENKADFDALFERMMAVQRPRPVTPDVDLGKNIVLYVSVGKKPTTGYGLKVNTVSCRGSTMQVLVDSTSPDPKGVAGQMVTNPALLLAIPRCRNMKAIEVTGADLRLRHDLASGNAQSGGIQ